MSSILMTRRHWGPPIRQGSAGSAFSVTYRTGRHGDHGSQGGKSGHGVRTVFAMIDGAVPREPVSKRSERASS